jgi:hypothetical protein
MPSEYTVILMIDLVGSCAGYALYLSFIVLTHTSLTICNQTTGSLIAYYKLSVRLCFIFRVCVNQIWARTNVFCPPSMSGQ